MCALEKFREKKEEEEGKIISSKKLRAKGFIFEDLRNLKKVEWMSNFILPLFIYFFSNLHLCDGYFWTSILC